MVGHAVTCDPRVADTAAMADTSCSDGTYALSEWHVSGTLNWHYNGGDAPASVADSAPASIASAAKTVGTGRNRCDLPANFSTVYAYAGVTTERPQVASDASCSGNDGMSVTGWGPLPPRMLAYTCTYYGPVASCWPRTRCSTTSRSPGSPALDRLRRRLRPEDHGSARAAAHRGARARRPGPQPRGS